jgi:hypothetical protein
MLASIGYQIWLPSCPVSKFFNMECFGCGLNRAAIALLSLDWSAAKASNPLAFIYLTAFSCLISYDFYKYYRMFGRSKYIK